MVFNTNHFFYFLKTLSIAVDIKVVMLEQTLCNIIRVLFLVLMILSVKSVTNINPPRLYNDVFPLAFFIFFLWKGSHSNRNHCHFMTNLLAIR